MIDRRTFLAGTGAVLLAAPLVAEAQPARRVPVVGILNIQYGPRRSARSEAFRRVCSELGYVEGQTISFELRFARMNPRPSLVSPLIWSGARSTCFVAIGPQATLGRKRCDQHNSDRGDRPGERPRSGWICPQPRAPWRKHHRLFLDQPGLTGKCLELIEEAAPGDPAHRRTVDTTTGGPWQLTAIKAGAAKLGIELHVLEIRGPGDAGSRA